MIIKWPGMKTGVDKEFHYSLDLILTFAEIFELQPYEHWDGQSYAKTFLEGEKCGRIFRENVV